MTASSAAEPAAASLARASASRSSACGWALAAMAVGGISEMFDYQAAKAPMKRNITGEEVGDTAAFLQAFRRAGLSVEVAVTRNLINETLTLYRVH